MNEPTRCACCNAPLIEATAAPAPEGATLRYHADFNTCIQYTLAQLFRNVPRADRAVVECYVNSDRDADRERADDLCRRYRIDRDAARAWLLRRMTEYTKDE